MNAQATGGKVTFFEWTADRGLVETVERFRSLDDLFAQCLASGQYGYIEEVLIAGLDATGATREVTLTFRSVMQPQSIVPHK